MTSTVNPASATADRNIRFAELFTHISQAVVYFDADGAAILANPAAEALFGLSQAEVQGRQPDALCLAAVQEDGLTFRAEVHPALVALQTGRPVKDVVMGVCTPQAPEQRWLLVSAVPEFHPGETRPYQAFVTYVDITAHKQAEAALRASEARFHSLFDSMQEGFYLAELIYDEAGKPVDWRFLDVNPAHERIIGRRRDEVIGRTVKELFPGLEEFWFDATVHTALTGEPLRVEGYVNDTGRYYENHYYSPRQGQFASIFLDITERKRAEQSAQDYARLYAVLSQVNQAIVRIKKAQPLFEAICEVAIRHGHFCLAWIGEYDLVTGEVKPLAECGKAGIELPFHDINVRKLPFQQGLMSLALDSGTVQYSNDIDVDASMAHWRPFAARDGLHAAAAIPLHQNGQIMGVLNLYAAETNFFHAEAEQHLLAEIGLDISYALDTMHLEEEQARAEQALHEEQLKLSTVAAAAPGLIYSFRRRADGTYCMPYASPILHELFGLDPGAVAEDAAPLFAGIDPEDLERVAVSIDRSARLLSPWHDEFRYRHPEKGAIWVEGRSMPLPEAEGVVIWHGFVMDITERKRREQALQASEEQYRGLVESLDSVVAVIDGQGRFLYMNEVAAHQLGGPASQLVGKTMRELFPEPVAATQLRDVLRVITEDQPMVVENPSIIQGQPRWYRTSIQPLHDAEGRAVTALLTSTDITQLKLVQRALEEINATLEGRVRERTAQIQDLYDNAPVGYHSLDADGTFVMVNQTELDWLGYARDELVGRLRFQEMLTPESNVRFAYSFPRFKQDGFLRDTEFELVRKDGSTFFVSVNAVAVYAADGQYLMSRSTVADITERKKAETELRLRQEELGAANAALAKAARLKDEFLASMSHELRTPLTGILGLSEALQTEVYGPLNEKQLRTIHSVEESGRHLLNLINDILDLSKIEAGKLVLEPSAFPVDELCQASLRLVKQMAATKGQTLTYTLNPAGIILRADPRRLKQAIVNLLSNAVKFTPEGGRLGLEVHGDRARNVIFFSVWDHGIGIAPEDAEKLFKPFVQLDSGLARSRTGTGLGLSLVHRLAELHGGSVTLESTPGTGSRFTLALPWLTEAPPAETAPPPGLAQPVTLDSALLVDDSADTIELLTGYLKELGIQEIVVHTRAEGATEQAVAARPAVILLDILLPDGSGWEILRRLKADSRTRAIPVVVVSVVDDRPRAMQLGAADHLLKPITAGDLQLALERAQQTHARHGVEPVLMILRKPAAATIVLAEDHEVNRQLLQDYLAIKGYHVMAVINGYEAVEAVAAQSPALVLMDIQMPGMDGLQAIRRIRAMDDPSQAQVPIIALTALAMPGDRERCLAAGADEYMSKPVDLGALLSLIRRLIEARKRGG